MGWIVWDRLWGIKTLRVGVVFIGGARIKTPSPLFFLSWETTIAKIDRGKKLISVAFYPPCASSPDLQRLGGACKGVYNIATPCAVFDKPHSSAV